MEEQSKDILRRLAREARRTATPAEGQLWKMLRDHRCGGLHFRRQEIVGPFRLDFFCRRLKIALEVDGSVHDEADVKRRDASRQQILEQEFGIQFLRVSNKDVLQRPEQVIERIMKLVIAQQTLE